MMFSGAMNVCAEPVRVAVASNFLSTLKEIKVAYEQQYPHEKIMIISGSTGKLYSQIIHNAPFDVFLAADQLHTQKLEIKGRVVKGSRFVYAQGQLILWGRNLNREILVDSVPQLLNRRFSMANPRTAPYGRAAEQVLQKVFSGQQRPRNIIQGENINQTFLFVATQNVALGFVALSQILNPANPYNRQHYWHIPASYYAPLKQEVGLLMRGRDKSSAINFLQYLTENDAKNIMLRYGYL